MGGCIIVVMAVGGMFDSVVVGAVYVESAG
jgi:hypothetical protein